MNEEKITTSTIRSGDSHAAPGEKIIGYTYLDSPEKNDSGHYVYNGAKEIDHSSEKCYAKSISYPENNTKHFIKTGRDGKIFNPWGMYSEGTETKQRGNENYWKFSSVNEKCFEYYLKFLQSRNSGWLISAEREDS